VSGFLGCVNLGRADAERRYAEHCYAKRCYADEDKPPPRLAWRQEQGPEVEYDRAELRAQIHCALGSLPPRDARAVRLRFGFDDGVERTLAEVGAELGVSRERVRQILQGALNGMGWLLYRGDPDTMPMPSYRCGATWSDLQRAGVARP